MTRGRRTGRGGELRVPPFAKIQFLFYSGACIEMLCIDFHKNRIINNFLKFWRRGGSTESPHLQKICNFYFRFIVLHIWRWYISLFMKIGPWIKILQLIGGGGGGETSLYFSNITENTQNVDRVRHIPRVSSQYLE